MAKLRIFARSLLIALLFFLIVPLHILLALLGKRDVIPPFFLHIIGRAAGLRITVKGRPQPGALILANHVSWLDILGLAAACRSTFVAHAGLASHRGLKWLCDQNDTVFITREKRQSVTGQANQLRNAFGNRPVTLFPEGTTDGGTSLLPFKSSLLSAVEDFAHTIPVQPVALDYRNAQAITWLGDEAGLANAAKILGRAKAVDLTIHFLPPLTSAALPNRKTMAAAAQAAIAEALGH